MKVGIIGTPNKDKLILPTGVSVLSWGGIIYNILTLHHYIGDRGLVRPICALGADSHDELISLFKKFSNIDITGAYKVAQKQNRVLLRCKSHDEKVETASLTLPPIPFDHIQKHLIGLDFLLVNFTSGRDVEKEEFRKVRKYFKKPILVDVHSLTLGDPDAKGVRRSINLRDWQEWLEGIDFVQFSWDEARCLTGESKTTFSGLVDIADWLLEHGTKGIIVTRAAEGALYFHSDSEGILKEEIPPFKLHNVVDTTGCGDVFSAAFISHYFNSQDPIKAAHFAVKASALKATFSGLGPWLSS